MWPFEKKQLPIVLPPVKPEELLTYMEAQQAGGIHASIEAALQKQIDATQYYQMFEEGNDGGNYFGSEFKIRATAGRIKKAYTTEPWMFATASLIARTLSSVPFLVVDAKTGEVNQSHPLNTKMKLGSKSNDAISTNWNGYLDMVLGGNYFRVFDELFTEAIQYPVERVQIRLNAQKTQIEYLEVYDGQGPQIKTLIPYKQVVHHKYPNPFYPLYGMSPYTAASRPMMLDKFKNEFEMAFYLRGATNSGVIETTEDINKTRMERLMRTFEVIYTGKRNWWRTIFLPKGSKWVSSGLTMSEMQHLEGLKENRLSLLAVLGIPPSQVGVVQDVNRSTSEAQERQFWVNTIKPMADFIAEGWNNSYLVKTIYSGFVKVVPDYSEIEALQGSLATKGEQAKSVESYLLIDEIRKDILGYDPLPDGKGQKFVAEIKAPSAQSNPLAALSAPTPEIIANPIAEVTGALSVQQSFADSKAQAVASQERIERKLTTDYLAGYQKYIDELLSIVEDGLKKSKDIAPLLKASIKKLGKIYSDGTENVLLSALNRGFSFASSQSKSMSMIGVMRTKKMRFNETDQQAIDALREEQADKQRTILIKRMLQNFLGFNETRSKEILDLVADGTEEGKTLEQIAATIREDYGEAYDGQSSTIARTELLSAVSQGIKWNHDVLGEVFTDVQKQWLHVGDVGSNPAARDWHAAFEDEGEKPSDYKWGGVLEYPRDPSAEPKETINCRCSMVSVIPDGATSNAEAILDRF